MQKKAQRNPFTPMIQIVFLRCVFIFVFLWKEWVDLRPQRLQPWYSLANESSFDEYWGGALIFSKGNARKDVRGGIYLTGSRTQCRHSNCLCPFNCSFSWGGPPSVLHPVWTAFLVRLSLQLSSCSTFVFVPPTLFPFVSPSFLRA